jgi:hypothetical protein
MADDMPPKISKHDPGWLLRALGLSPRALLLVALLTLAVWWYFYNEGMALNTMDTAVVVLALALVAAACRAVGNTLRRLWTGDRGKPGGVPK